MRATCCFLLFWTPLLFTPSATGNVPLKNDTREIAGHWTLQNYRCEEQSFDEPLLPRGDNPVLRLFGIQNNTSDAYFTIEVGNNLISFSSGVELVLRQADLRLDPITKSIDLSIGTKNYPGIYKVEGNKLTLCITSGKTRPTEFKATQEQVVFHFEKSN